ncbi:MAG: hypothetical protein FWJ70_17875 [Micromonosporaceae bacterium]
MSVTFAGAELADAARRIVVARNDGQCILGRPDYGIYVTVPEAGAVFIEALQAGESVADAGRRASVAAGAEVDVADFLTGLTQAGLLQPPAEATDSGAAAGASTGGRRKIRWLEGVSQEAAGRLFGRAGWTCYGLAAAAVLAILAIQPDLRPSYEHLWWLPDPVVAFLLLVPLAMVLAAGHEAWHWLAGRAAGVPAAFRVSRRGIFLTFETDLTQLVTKPRRARYGPFLAGMAFDLTMLCAFLCLRLAHRSGILVLPHWLDRLFAAVILLVLVGIFWQWAALFLRTDGYAVLANALRCNDLYRATWLTTKQRLWRLTSHEVSELESISAHDRQVAKWFALLYVAGLAGMAWLALAVGLPFAIGLIGWVGHNLANPSLVSPAFWKSAALVALVVGQYLAVLLLTLRERRLRRAGVLR